MSENPENGVPAVKTPPVLKKRSFQSWKRMLAIPVVAIVGFLIIWCVFLFLYQGRMIYFPRDYEKGYQEIMPAEMVELDYEMSAGEQRAFYLPPENGGQPEAVWVHFSGNASLALDWLDVVDPQPDPSAGHLLLDYPGYVFNEGTTNPSSIKESSEAALEALADELGMEMGELEERLNVIGF